MVGNGILNNLEELLVRVGALNRKAVEKLDHQTSKTLESARNADGWRNLDENALCRLNVDLELASLVDGRIKKCEEALR